MKKTLVALAVAAFASSASALTVYENEGSKVDFDGSVRLLLEKNGSKENGQTTKRAHSNLHNDGTRFEIKAKHAINDDLYAISRLRFMFDGNKKDVSGDQFGNLHANRAYVGLGSKTYGEVTFGRQATIADDILQSGFDMQYHNFSGLMTTGGKSVVRYDYKGIEGLQVGVDYRFAEDRAGENAESLADDAVAKAEAALKRAQSLNDEGKIKTAEKALKAAQTALEQVVGEGEVAVGKLKSGYGIGAVYTFGVGEGQEATVAAGYTRDNFVSPTSKKHHKDAWGTGAKYQVNDLTVAADYVGSFEKDANSKKVRANGLRVGAQYKVTPAVAVYTNYGYGVSKTKVANVTSEKKSVHSYILGSTYKLHKNVLTYVEGGVDRTTVNKGNNRTKSTDKNIGIGLRVFW